jgi:hypothetical protein
VLLQGLHTHPDVVISTYQPLLPRVPHQGRCDAAVRISRIVDYANMSYNLNGSIRLYCTLKSSTCD